MALSKAQIDLRYLEVLSRHATAAEQDAFSALSNTESTAQIDLDIATLPEATQFVDPLVRLYQGAFGRLPDTIDPNGNFDTGGQSGFWVNTNALRSGVTLLGMANAFVASAEFLGQYGSTTVTPALITAYYQHILGRDPSSSEVSAWQATGLNAAQILIGFTESAEFKARSQASIDNFKVALAEGQHPSGPLPPPPPELTLDSDLSAVNEGGTVTFTLQSTNAVDFGKTFSYNVSGVSAADVVGGNAALTGSVTLDAQGLGHVAITLVNDKTTEGAEALTMSFGALSKSVTVNDTSLSPTYSLSGPVTANEGSTALYQLTTTNVDAGTQFAYTLSGISAADVVGGQLTGVATVDAQGIAVIQVALVSDNLTEGPENLVVTVPLANNVSKTTTVVDTSLSPTFTLTKDAASHNEGETAKFTLQTTGIAAGTQFSYTITGAGITAADVIGGLLTGTATIDANGKAVIDVALANDLTTEGAESLTLTVAGQSQTVTVTDSSQTPAFGLTAGADLGAKAGDKYFGGIGDDTYVGQITTASNDLGAGDDLNGNDGTDSVSITVLNDLTNVNHLVNGFKTTSVENFIVSNLDVPNSVTIDMTNTTGVQNLTVRDSVEDVIFQDMQVDFGNKLSVVDSHGLNITVDYDIQALQPGGQVLDVTLSETDIEDFRISQNLDNGAQQAGPMETIAFHTTGLASSIEQVITGSAATTKITVDGTADLRLGGHPAFDNNDGSNDFAGINPNPSQAFGSTPGTYIPGTAGDWLGNGGDLPGLQLIDASTFQGNLNLALADDLAGIRVNTGLGDHDGIVFQSGAWNAGSVVVDSGGGHDEIAIDQNDISTTSAGAGNPVYLVNAQTNGIESVTVYEDPIDGGGNPIFVSNFNGIKDLNLLTGLLTNGNDNSLNVWALPTVLNVNIDQQDEDFNIGGGNVNNLNFLYDNDAYTGGIGLGVEDAGTANDTLNLKLAIDVNGQIDNFHSQGVDTAVIDLSSSNDTLTVKQFQTPNMDSLFLNVRDGGSVLRLSTGAAGDTSTLTLVDGTLSNGALVLANNDDFLDPVVDLVVSTAGATMLGGNGNDVMEGNSGNDIMSGNGGVDTLRGHGGNDQINGGTGGDHLFGENGNDTIHGDNDADDVHGGSGNDTLFGDAGNDAVIGGAGNDTVDGGTGADSLTGDGELAGTPGRAQVNTYTVGGIIGVGDTFVIKISGAGLAGGDETVQYSAVAGDGAAQVAAGLAAAINANADLNDPAHDFTASSAGGVVTLTGPASGVSFTDLTLAIDDSSNTTGDAVKEVSSVTINNAATYDAGDIIRITIDGVARDFTVGVDGTLASTIAGAPGSFLPGGLNASAYTASNVPGSNVITLTADVATNDPVINSAVVIDKTDSASAGYTGWDVGVETFSVTIDGTTTYSDTTVAGLVGKLAAVGTATFSATPDGTFSIDFGGAGQELHTVTFAGISGGNGGVVGAITNDTTTNNADPTFVDNHPTSDNSQSLTSATTVTAILTQDGAGVAGADTFVVHESGTNLTAAFTEATIDKILDFNQGSGAYNAGEGDTIHFGPTPATGGPAGSITNYAEFDATGIASLGDILATVNSVMQAGPTVYVNVTNVAAGLLPSGSTDLLFADLTGDGQADAVASVLGVTPAQLNFNHIV